MPCGGPCGAKKPENQKGGPCCKDSGGACCDGTKRCCSKQKKSSPSPTRQPSAQSQAQCGASKTQTVYTKTTKNTPCGPSVKTTKKVIPLSCQLSQASVKSSPSSDSIGPPLASSTMRKNKCAASNQSYKIVVAPPTSVTGKTPFTKSVFREALEAAMADPKNVIKKFGGTTNEISEAPIIMTKKGPERAIQQMTIEKTVQRTPKLQFVHKYVKGIDMDPSGKGKQIEMTSQEIDPSYGTDTTGVMEAISVSSTVSVTSSGKKQAIKKVKKKTLRSEDNQLNLNPQMINRLVREENEDIENTLRMVPPNLVSQSPGKYPLKKKWQRLRLARDSMAALEQTIPIPTPTADEVDMEVKPEVIVSIMRAMEHGMPPIDYPDRIFNTLFPEVKERQIVVSPVAPGPFEDVVIPIQGPHDITSEMINDEMQETLMEVLTVVQMPRDDIASENKITPPARTPKGSGNKPDLNNTATPWTAEDVNKVSDLVGNKPMQTLEPIEPKSLEESTDPLTKELASGLQYFLNADASPYETKIQIRGSRLPGWFPGYVSVFPHLPDLVKLNKTPSIVLHTAWKTTQPKIFPIECVTIV